MTELDANSFNRTALLMVQSGAAPTLEQAVEKLRSFVLQVHVGRIGGNATLQAALLTIVNAARRGAFMGGVHVVIEEDCTVVVGWQRGQALTRAVAYYGGEVVRMLAPERPTICVGEPSGAVTGRRVLRAVASGWTGGVVEGLASPIAEFDTCVLGGIAAGSIAVAEAFEMQRGSNVVAGRRSNGISLWRPGTHWLADDAIGPDDFTYAPSDWWLVGLGHLGQGYLWSIGMLPYRDPAAVSLMLQDDDVLTVANESTSLLIPLGTVRNEERRRKTRHLASRLEDRGFNTTITERRLSLGDRRRGNEPRLALVGVDNPETRRPLSTMGFDYVIDVGLGEGTSHYLDVHLHTFPGSRDSSDVPGWEDVAPTEPDLHAGAFQSALGNADANERCGLVELAGKAIAVPFVGAVAGAIAVAEAVRALRGDARHEILSTSLRQLHPMNAVVDTDHVLGNLGFAALR